MSDVLTLERPKSKEKKKAGKVRAVLRVLRDGRWLGDVLLGSKNRVWRHVEAVPGDVVLKALAAFTRGEVRGEFVGRRDGLAYSWHEVADEPQAVEAAAVVAFAEAA